MCSNGRMQAGRKASAAPPEQPKLRNGNPRCRDVLVFHLLDDVDVYLGRDVSLRHLLDDVDVAQGELAPYGLGCGRGEAANHRAPAMVGTTRR